MLHLVSSIPTRILMVVSLICVPVTGCLVHAQKAMRGRTIRLLTRDGKVLEGTLAVNNLTMQGARSIPMESLLSINLAADASPHESERITADLVAAQGADRIARDTAVAELTALGLTALTPVLNAYKDRDLREPDALYRLFSRLMPGYADTLDRSLDLIRLKNGEALRGRLGTAPLALKLPDGSEIKVALDKLRALSVRQALIEKSFEVHALKHCTQIEFLDTGVILGPQSRVELTANGFVRLSFGIDGWASDPDGLKVPGPNYKTNLVDGFPFGALVGKVGIAGPRFLVGRHLDKNGLGEGRLYLAVNDNGHWQNNIGSFRVKLRISNGYDLGDPQ